MDLSQQQMYSVIALVLLGIAYLVGKVFEAKYEKLDLDGFNTATGFGAFFALIWVLNNFGAFS